MPEPPVIDFPDMRLYARVNAVNQLDEFVN